MDQLQRLRHDILVAVEETLRRIPPPAYRDSKDASFGQGAAASSEPPTSMTGELQLMQAAKESLDALLRCTAGPSPEIRVLKQLYFTSLYQREDNMDAAGVRTFEWILGHASHDVEDQTPKHSVEHSDDDTEDRTPQHPIEGSDDKMREYIAKKRETAAARFLDWLRNENGVFHISGKPGSGKSTMMKIILNDTRTKQALEQWAGEKRLVFAHFFFWSSGVELQRSLEGLYRSILFEILLHCPELIPDVFPNAYRAFSVTRAQESIDELFFGFPAIQKAFEDLITRSPKPGYRYCLLIDGLDEYGGDAVSKLEHQCLADAFNDWAAQDDVKILASSRPHSQFEETFSDERRIRLHELTRLDIILAGRQMFENDRFFKRRPEIQDCYVDLVEKVASASEGVFLWASLAIRALLNAVARYDPIDSLEKQLEGIPRDFNALYEKLFMSIDPADRVKAFKLLLLVAETPRWVGILNAQCITWLRDLEDDPEFPTHCEFKPYTDKEIERRHLEAKAQVDSLTKGLVEVTAKDGRSCFYQKQLQFFHRTVRDFVRQSQAIQEFVTKCPDFTGITTYARLLLTELYFVNTDHVDSTAYSNILSEYEYPENVDGLLDAFGRAYDYHNKLSETSGKTPVPFCGFATELENSGSGRAYGAKSFLHFMAKEGFVNYIQRKIATNPNLPKPQGEMSLLLSVALYWKSPLMVKALLEAGASPQDRVWSLSSIHNGQERAEYTIWQLVSTAFACRMLQPQPSTTVRTCCETLQYFFEAGVDFNCFALLSPEKDGPPTHAISLRTLVQQRDPPNLEKLLLLMEEPKGSRGILGAFGAAWDYLTGGKPDAAKCGTISYEDYIPFDLAMDPYIIAYDPYDGEPEHVRPSYFVTGVKCGDAIVSPDVFIKYC